MKPKRNLRIQGTLTLTSPLHISMPGAARYNPSTRRMSFGDDPRSPFICTPTRSLEVVNHDLAESSDRATVRIPVIPANGWRGRLRRAAANIIEESLMAAGNKVNYGTYQSMHSGAITGSPDGVTVPLDQVRLVREHVFLGLFGGSSKMVPSCYTVSNSYPLLGALIESGVIPTEAADQVMPVGLQDVWRTLFECIPNARVNDVSQMRDPEVDLKIEDADLRTNLLDQLEQTARKKDQKARKAADATTPDEAQSPLSLQFMSYAETVTTGTRFWQTVTASGTEAQLGLLLLALARVMDRPVGGKSGAGMGTSVCRLTATLDGESLGEVLTSAGGLAHDNPEVRELVAAAEAEIAALTPDSLWAIFKPADKAKAEA